MKLILKLHDKDIVVEELAEQDVPILAALLTFDGNLPTNHILPSKPVEEGPGPATTSQIPKIRKIRKTRLPNEQDPAPAPHKHREHHVKGLDIVELKREYAKGKSLSELGEQFDLSGPTVGKLLKENGVKLRSRGETKMLRNRSSTSEPKPSPAKLASRVIYDATNPKEVGECRGCRAKFPNLKLDSDGLCRDCSRKGEDEDGGDG